LILAGSIYDQDYKSGGVRFHVPGKGWIETETQHVAGDIILFRYDLLHEITPVDPSGNVDWTRDDGRWSFVFPRKPVLDA
jgi:hypothetical protein